MLGIIIQARLGSTRLPNKMLMPFYEQKGILELLIKRLQNEFNHIPIVVATTNKYQDVKIIELCKRLDVHSFAGDENDVLERFIRAGDYYQFDKIIRIIKLIYK